MRQCFSLPCYSEAGSSDFLVGEQSVLIDLSSWYKESLTPQIQIIRSAIKWRLVEEFGTHCFEEQEDRIFSETPHFSDNEQEKTSLHHDSTTKFFLSLSPFYTETISWKNTISALSRLTALQSFLYNYTIIFLD